MVLLRAGRPWNLTEGKALCVGGWQLLCSPVNPPSVQLQSGLYGVAAVRPRKERKRQGKRKELKTERRLVWDHRGQLWLFMVTPDRRGLKQ